MDKDSLDHSFVIKIWLDSIEDETANRQLHGRVTHAYTKEHSPVHNPADIIAFIKPYLRKMGVKLSLRNQLVLWLCR